MNRWRRSGHGAGEKQRETLRRSSEGLFGPIVGVLAVGVVGVGVLLLGTACQRDPLDEHGVDPHRVDGRSGTPTHLALSMAWDPAVSRKEVVAWIDGEPVLIAEARSLLGGGGGDGGGGSGSQDPVQRRMAVEGAIARRLLARVERAERGAHTAQTAEAPREGGSRDGESGWTRASADRVPGIDALFDRLRDGLSLSEEELRAHYEKTRSRYRTRQIRLRRQVLATEADAAATETPLPELDPMLSDVVGPAALHDLPPSLLPEVLELQTVGERIVIERDAAGERVGRDAGKGPGGAILVELLEILPAEPLSFERVRDQVEASLRTLRGQKAMRARLAELRAARTIAIEEAALRDDDLWETAGASPRARAGPPDRRSRPPRAPRPEGSRPRMRPATSTRPSDQERFTERRMH